MTEIHTHCESKRVCVCVCENVLARFEMRVGKICNFNWSWTKRYGHRSHCADTQKPNASGAMLTLGYELFYIIYWFAQTFERCEYVHFHINACWHTRDDFKVQFESISIEVIFNWVSHKLFTSCFYLSTSPHEMHKFVSYDVGCIRIRIQASTTLRSSNYNEEEEVLSSHTQ